MVSKLLLNVPGTTLLATRGTAFAEARAAKIFRASEVDRIDAFGWLDHGVASLEGVSTADAQVLATRGIASLRALALAPHEAIGDLAPKLVQTLANARITIRSAAERHGISLVA